MARSMRIKNVPHAEANRLLLTPSSPQSSRRSFMGNRRRVVVVKIRRSSPFGCGSAALWHPWLTAKSSGLFGHFGHGTAFFRFRLAIRFSIGFGGGFFRLGRFGLGHAFGENFFADFL